MSPFVIPSSPPLVTGTQKLEVVLPVPAQQALKGLMMMSLND